MKKWKGGTKCQDGLYFNCETWEFVPVREGKPTVLPGEMDVNYYKVPFISAIIAGPVFGLVFAIFLPLFGIISLVGFSLYKLLRSRKSPRPAHNHSSQ